MTTTLTAALVLLNRSVLASNMLVLPSEVIGMASRTVWLVLGERPGNDTADGVAMATRAARITAMVSGIVTIRIMRKGAGGPGVGAMANITLFRGV